MARLLVMTGLILSLLFAVDYITVNQLHPIWAVGIFVIFAFGLAVCIPSYRNRKSLNKGYGR